MFKLPESSYSVSEIQDYIKYIIKNMKHYPHIPQYIFTSIPASICWSSRRLQEDMSRRLLQHVFSLTIFRLPRRLQDILQGVLKWICSLRVTNCKLRVAS